jgi:hypothetical protein
MVVEEKKKLEGLSKYFPIEDYYRKAIIPIDKRRFHISSSNKMICPLHNDHDPSLGVIVTNGKETFHCFGCNAWGDVVDLHILIAKKYYKRYLNREEAIKELCRLFKVNEDVALGLDSKKENSDVKRDGLIEEGMNKFDITDYRYNILNGKIQKRPIGYFNALMMSMIWELKHQEG